MRHWPFQRILLICERWIPSSENSKSAVTLPDALSHLKRYGGLIPGRPLTVNAATASSHFLSVGVFLSIDSKTGGMKSILRKVLFHPYGYAQRTLRSPNRSLRRANRACGHSLRKW